MASTNLGTTIGNALLGLRESGVAPGVRSNPLRSQLLADAIAESNASAANLPQSQFEGLARGFLQGFTGANAADDRNPSTSPLSFSSSYCVAAFINSCRLFLLSSDSSVPLIKRSLKYPLFSRIN